MELCIKLATRPLPEIRARVLVLIISLIAELAIWRAGYQPATAIPVALGAGLAGARVARVLLNHATPADLPSAGPIPGLGGDLP